MPSPEESLRIVWPPLPFEYIIDGTPISLQGSPGSKAEWKARVEAAARAALPEGGWLLTDPLAITIYIFPQAPLPGDIDNRVKPILDGMCMCVYADDEQVERLVVQKFEPERVYAFANPSAVLASALGATQPVVYIRITDDLHEELS